MRTTAVLTTAFLAACSAAFDGRTAAAADLRPKLASPTDISSFGRDSDPDAAFDAVRGVWLVVWREGDPTVATTARVMGRFIRDSGAFASPPIPLTDFHRSLSSPRIARDPLGDEWLIVFVAGGSPLEPASTVHVNARRISPGGVPRSWPRPISTGDAGEANPDVAAATVQSIPFPPSPVFVAVWEEVAGGRREIRAASLHADPGDPTGVGVSGLPFRVDASPDLPSPREAFRPRITTAGPVVSFCLGPRCKPVDQTSHRVAFEVESAGRRDVHLADVVPAGLRSVVRVTGTDDDEMAPAVAWSARSGRSLVLFQRGGKAVLSSSAPAPGRPALP
jgi:hypothetical protein